LDDDSSIDAGGCPPVEGSGSVWTPDACCNLLFPGTVASSSTTKDYVIVSPCEKATSPGDGDNTKQPDGDENTENTGPTTENTDDNGNWNTNDGKPDTTSPGDNTKPDDWQSSGTKPGDTGSNGENSGSNENPEPGDGNTQGYTVAYAEANVDFEPEQTWFPRDRLSGPCIDDLDDLPAADLP
jgi:hypothetical protein